MSNAAVDEANALFSQSDRLRTHPEDSRSRTPSEPDLDVADVPESSTMPSLTSNYQLPRGTMFDANTGPKGVIADARAFEIAKKQKWMQQRKAANSGTGDGQVFYGQREVSPIARDGRSTSPQSQEDEKDDDEFMDRWRKSRLTELRSGDVRNRRQSPSMRRYGTFQTVDAVGYLDAIEKVGRETTVIVCIYDDQVRCSYFY